MVSDQCCSRLPFAFIPKIMPPVMRIQLDVFVYLVLNCTLLDVDGV